MSFIESLKWSDVADEAKRRIEERNQKVPESQRIQVGSTRKLSKRDNLLLMHYIGQSGAVTKNRECRVRVVNKSVVIRYGAEA